MSDRGYGPYSAADSGADEPGSREPMHQPPNPADLRSSPPMCRECAMVRGQLRDFVDGDLDAAGRQAVELHVHACRACGVSLARYEHEVLRLRRAFAVHAAAEGQSALLPHDFAARVRQRLVLDETSMVSREELSRALVGGALASAAANAQSAPPMRGPNLRRARRWLVSRPGSLFVGALVLLLSFLLGLSFVDGDTHPERGGRLVLTVATDVYGDLGDRHFRLSKVGDGLGDNQTMWVGPNGAARADWHDASAKNQPAATLLVDGNGTVRVEGGSPVLVNGEVHVETHRDVRIPVADGSVLELGIGEYLLSADMQQMPPHWDPLNGAPGDLQVRIEVLRGASASVVRMSSPVAHVELGSRGIYRGNAPVDIRAIPNFSSDPSGLVVRRPDPGGLRDAVLSGQVFERSGAVAVGADVLLSFASNGVGRSVGATVDSHGQFSLATGLVGTPQAIDSPFAIVQVVPSPYRPGLGLTAPEAYRLNYQDGSARLAQSLVLDYTAELVGSVVDETGMARAGVRVVPCVIDELFGTLLPWPQGHVITDATGLLRLPQLPVSLPAHQYLALALLHPDLEPTMVAVPWRGSAAGNERPAPFVAPRLRVVRMHGLPPNSTVSVFEDVAGLPPGSAAVLHTIPVGSTGATSVVRVGRGRLWLRNTSPADPRLKELVLGEYHGQASYHPQQGSNPQPLAMLFQSMQSLLGTNLSIASSFRHQRFQRAASPAAVGGETLTVVDGLSGHAAQAAQVFATRPAVGRGPAQVRFLGFTSANGSLPLDLEIEDNGVFAIGVDGSTGWLDENAIAAQAWTLELSANGEVLLGAGLRPDPGSGTEVVPIRFERTSSALPGVSWCAYRFACAVSGWKVGDLPPGEYRAVIDGHAFPVVVPSNSTVVLQ